MLAIVAHDPCLAPLTQVVPILESTTVLSPEIGLDLPAAITGTTQAVGKVFIACSLSYILGLFFFFFASS